MAEATEGWRGLLDGLLGVARDYVTDGVAISVKTNYGPEIPVATAALGGGEGAGGASGGSGIVASLLGVKAAVIVRNQNGQVISTFGDVPKTDPVRAIVAGLLVAGFLYLAVRGALK